MLTTFRRKYLKFEILKIHDMRIFQIRTFKLEESTTTRFRLKTNLQKKILLSKISNEKI